MIVQSNHLNKPKVFLTHGLLPKYVDSEQLPAKDKPWSVILRHRWVSSVELCLDEHIYEEISLAFLQTFKTISWSRVVLPLSGLIEGEFYRVYVKAGNVSMLSRGRPGLDPLYTLRNGTLRLELPKEVYERTGLVGSAIRDGGRKHVKTHFAIELDLRQPSMIRGKKGFDRVVWAFANVLTESVTWLFHDHWQAQTSESGSVPLLAHSPAIKAPPPTVTRLESVRVPSMRSWSGEPRRTDDDAADLLDWFGMMALNSPRLSSTDTIDPFLCRYQVPDAEIATTSNLVRVVWTGFIQGEWVRELLLECMKATTRKPEAWYAISAKNIRASSEDTFDGYTLLRSQLQDDSDTPGASKRPEFIIWEMDSCNNN